MIRKFKSSLKSRVCRYGMVKSLFLLRRIYSLFNYTTNIDPSIKKILIIHPQMVGDTIVATPMIRNLHYYFKEANIMMVTHQNSEELLKDNPYIHKLYIYKTPKWSKYFDLVKQLQKEKFDLVIDTQMDFLILKRVLFPFFVGRKYRVGFKRGKGYCGFLNTHETNFRITHGAESYLDLIRTMGVPVINKHFDVYVTKNNQKWAREVIKKYKSNKNPVIGIHAGNVNESKRWSPKKFADIADYLIKNYKATIIFMGTDSEEHQINSITSMMKKKAINLLGKTSLGQYSALIKNLDLLITLDTGAVHIAAATNTPTVALYGQTYMLKWFPWNTKKQILLTKYPECHQCKNENMDYIIPSEVKERICLKSSYECIFNIKEGEVIAAAKKLLK